MPGNCSGLLLLSTLASDLLHHLQLLIQMDTELVVSLQSIKLVTFVHGPSRLHVGLQ
eukprot:CAMPEP_0172905918 /NCGR_PEP_ID=MMETSP1075-20121228/175731_1 /TAXON_ID=2916 /ORGANISM="Ceratium fusus, Strain PA161109" /LENGTH=56 /DNA_ID=CAMNT_0013763255 /DNA_START=400 /DNA_END=567 /DNA_ORIENTATION=+